jgi:GNAT superfamily N-acetyltransferase
MRDRKTMISILEGQSITSPSRAIEANMFAWLPLFGSLPGGLYVDTGKLKRSITPIPFALFNSIMDARIPESRVDRTIREVIEEASTRHVPVRWWIGPSTRPQNLAEHLESFGFTLGDDAPGMAVELNKLNENLPKPEGLSVSLCASEDEKRRWSQVMGTANEIPEEASFVVDAWADFLVQTDARQMQPYLAWWQAKPVATCLQFLGGGVAGIYAVATVPGARRKGIGAWVTCYALLRARELGYRVGVLESSEMGLGVYKRLGFQEYCRISSYNWQLSSRGSR